MKRFLPMAIALLLAAPLPAQQTDSERLLLPIFTPPIHGAHGSEFHTELRMANTGEDPILVLGIQSECLFLCPPLPFPVYLLAAGGEAGPGDFDFNGSPGRFLFVAQDQVSSLAMSLRVRDVTRQAESFGTEIPIPRDRDFVDGPIHFVGVPTDPRFRNALRIYASFPMDVLVTVGNRPPVRISLTGPDVKFPPTTIPDLSRPAYGFFADFPTDGAPVRVTVEPEPGIIITSQLLPFETPIWAFITVTNNETQAIATITPQP